MKLFKSKQTKSSDPLSCTYEVVERKGGSGTLFYTATATIGGVTYDLREDYYHQQAHQRTLYNNVCDYKTPRLREPLPKYKPKYVLGHWNALGCIAQFSSPEKAKKALCPVIKSKLDSIRREMAAKENAKYKRVVASGPCDCHEG